MRRTLSMQPNARRDLIRIASSIRRSVSAKSASNWRVQIEAVLEKLQSDADIWPEAEEAETLEMDLRCRLFGRQRHVYPILFTIESETVFVHAVRHAAQDFITDNEL